MAIYRPPKARWPLAIAVGLAGLLVGLGIGVLVGDEETAPSEAASEIRSILISAAGSLEVAEVEYEESVTNGEITRQAEYDGAMSALESSRDRYGEVAAAFETLAPERAIEIEAGYDDCETLMTELADASQVSPCLVGLADLLSGDA